MDTNKVNKKINPYRKISDIGGYSQTYLLYTIEEGGELLFRADFSREDFDNLVKRGWFKMAGPGDYIQTIYPAFAELVQGVIGYDFRLDEIYGNRKRPEERITKVFPIVR